MRIRTKIIVVCFLVISAARAQEIDKSKLKNLLIQAQETNTEAVLVYKDNQLVTENYFGFGHVDKKTESMSCTKSIVGLAMACILSDKLIDSLDVQVSHFYPEWRQGQKQLITIRHLMNMTSGLQNNPNASVEIYPSPDFVQLALAAELSYKPGEIWSYNNKSLNLMAGVIEKITGKRMDVYIGERLFNPLGIKDFTWSLDNSGNPHVMSGCQIRPIDFAKIGHLLLNNGIFNDEVVIASEHLTEVITPSKQFERYGMLWWIDYEKSTSIVDDEIISELKNAGISRDFIAKAILMKGSYKSEEEYSIKLKEVFGESPGKYIGETLGSNLRIRKREYSGKITYRADGYLGNYIIVDPESKIVAVRMISHQSFNNEKDNFVDFRKLVLSLTE